MIVVCAVVYHDVLDAGPASPDVSEGRGPTREYRKFHWMLLFVFHVTVTLCFHFKGRCYFLPRLRPLGTQSFRWLRPVSIKRVVRQMVLRDICSRSCFSSCRSSRFRSGNSFVNSI